MERFKIMYQRVMWGFLYKFCTKKKPTKIISKTATFELKQSCESVVKDTS